MTVLTSPVVKGLNPITKARMRSKRSPEIRPVTATLDCPVILDITFLKKLDMTSFTKKGLIAISKICGISLIKRTDDKKLRKRLKRQTVERAKIEARKRLVESSEELPKVREVPKMKTSVRTKIENVKCRGKSKEAKPSVEDILYGPIEVVVTEPCKTCGRSEQPERFHSHPKQGKSQSMQKKSVSSFDETGKEKLAAPKGNAARRHSTGHLQSPSRLRVSDAEPSFHSDHEIESIKMSLPKTDQRRRSFSPGDNIHRTKLKNKEGGSALKKKADVSKQEKSPQKNKTPSKASPEEKSSGYSSQEDLKYVTGCYVCGKQMSAELRFAHEEQCIAEWRRQNSHLPPDKRKAEPLRPDFRFTATGDVDFEGTFNSIWANHMDSLVPCAKCKRTFFPERIEKHQACCNLQPVKGKHAITPRNK